MITREVRLGIVILGAVALAGCAAPPTRDGQLTQRDDPVRSAPRPAPEPAPARSSDYAQQIWDQLQVHRAAIGARNMHHENFIVGHLDHGDSDYWGLQLLRGRTYVISAACDVDCPDIDLIIRDDRGNEIDSDTLTDDYPVLEFRPPYAGEYELEVRMYSCNVNPCYYGFGVFRD